MIHTDPGPAVTAAPYATPDALRGALLDAGLLVATRTDGVYHRSGDFERVVQGVERYGAAQRMDATAQRRWFPPIMAREDFLRTDYLRSFPDLVGSIDIFTGGDAEHRELLAALEEGADWTRSLNPAEVVLSSSICHSLYGTLPTEIPEGGLLNECCGFAFRHEPSLDPARMQSFRMYEFVLVGTPAEAVAHRDAWLQRGLDSLGALGLHVRSEIANDPFFGRVGRMLAANQVSAELKYEVVMDITAARPTAVSSANYHEDHFGLPFGMTTPDGNVAHSACFGYGLERITLGLFATHGLDVTGWPAEGPGRTVVLTEHHQVWFGPDDRPLYGWVSVPAGGRAAGGAILCPPMGEESRAAHRTYRRLAETLAEAGIVALRFDYEGTGDSAGLQDDPGRVASWLASVEAARRYLLDLGAPSVAAVGMRLGATIAACQAAEAPFDSLVLWDPCLSGRTFLREGEALYLFGADPHDSTPDDGYRHTPGFQYDASTASAMRGLDIAKLPTGRSLAGRVLLLNRVDRPVAESIEGRLRLMPGQLDTLPALGQDQLLDRTPSDCFVPEEALASVVDWLAGGVDRADEVPIKTPEADLPVLVRSAGPATSQVREQSVRIGDFGLYGIADEPVATPAHPGDGQAPWVVLVNVAAEHHIGPGRIWVEFARRWAAMGYRCLRLDQSGIGDSPTHPGQLEDEPFAPEWIEDMRDVVRTVAAGGAPVVIVGLCSGAYSAFEVAMWEHVDAVFAVNPRLTLYPAAKGTPVYTNRRRAGILPNAPIAALARRRRILAGGLWRIYRQVAVWHAPFVVLRKVRRRGTAIEVNACRDDAQHFTEVLFWRPWFARLRRDPRFRFRQDETFDHSLLGRAGQQATFDRATDFIERELAGRVAS